MLLQYYLINIFIIFYIILAWFGSDPKTSFLRQIFDRVCDYLSILRSLALFYDWTMFSSTVKSREQLEVYITFSDNSVIYHPILKLEDLNIFQAFLLVRHRKFYSNVLSRIDDTAKLSFINFLIRKYTSSSRIPVRIELYADTQEFPPPEEIELQWQVLHTRLIYLWQREDYEYDNFA